MFCFKNKFLSTDGSTHFSKRCSVTKIRRFISLLQKRDRERERERERENNIKRKNNVWYKVYVVISHDTIVRRARMSTIMNACDWLKM